MTHVTLSRMAYCKHTGKPLPHNLYNDPKGRPGVYRYRKPDGSFRLVRLPYAKAVEAARAANARRIAPEGSLPYWVAQYRQWCVDREPPIESRRGWSERQKQLEAWADDWQHVQPIALTVPTLADWWDALTYDQQHNRRAHFSAFCQWCMGKGVMHCNPFSARDDVARLMEKRKPMKQRGALSLEGFRAIHEAAPAHIQIAMRISLSTAMRAGDVVALRWDCIQDGYLCKTIAKSVGQRGATAAAHLKWWLDEHEALKQAIDEARELSMKHRRCPYIVSRPRAREKALGAGLTHSHQCRVEHLSRGFARARDAAGIDGPSFHEVRGLAISLLLQQGQDIAAVQRLAAHTDASITSAYTAGQAPHYMDMAGLVVKWSG